MTQNAQIEGSGIPLSPSKLHLCPSETSAVKKVRRAFSRASPELRAPKPNSLGAFVSLCEPFPTSDLRPPPSALRPIRNPQSPIRNSHSPWICLDLPGFAWICLDLPGFGWIWLDLPGFGWICLDLPECTTRQRSLNRRGSAHGRAYRERCWRRSRKRASA